MKPDLLLEALNVVKEYPRRGDQPLIVLNGASLAIARGEFVCVLGPSGCGKSTLLRIAAGLERSSRGSVRFDGHPVNGPSLQIGLIFQRSTLFKWLTLVRNVEFAARSMPGAKGREREIALRSLSTVGLDEFANARPNEISGGMTQRATLARALATNPSVLLLDEPFSALDAMSRLDMHKVLLDAWANTAMSILFVTHDVDEAIELGDRVLIMSRRPGTFVDERQIDLPRPRISEGVVCEGFELARNEVARRLSIASKTG